MLLHAAADAGDAVQVHRLAHRSREPALHQARTQHDALPVAAQVSPLDEPQANVPLRRRLTAISKQSLDIYKKLNATTDKPFSFEQKGLFMAAQSDDGFNYARTEMELVARNGVPGKLMDEEEARAFEPSLTKRFKGGVFFPEEAHAEPLQVVQMFAHEAQKLGARIFSKAEVIDFQLGAKRNRSGAHHSRHFQGRSVRARHRLLVPSHRPDP